MALETGTYIDDLNENNPTGSDSKSKGDDHLRLIKKTIKNSFPNITGAMTATQAELNKLDGCTATTAELNKVAGLSASTADLDAVAGIITTEGDLMLGDASGDESRLAIGGNNTVLKSNGTTASWGAVPYAAMSFSNDIVAGDIAAGAVDNSEIASSAVHRSELNTSTGSTSGTINNGAEVNITLNAYSLFPNVHAVGGASEVRMGGHQTDGSSADGPRFGLYNDGGSNRTYDVDHRYIAA